MAQVTNSTTHQTGKDEAPRRKARFRILPDGKHEHNLVDVGCELRSQYPTPYTTLLRASGRSNKTQNVEEVGRNADSSA
jgi:hypothetical protein